MPHRALHDNPPRLRSRWHTLGLLVGVVSSFLLPGAAVLRRRPVIGFALLAADVWLALEAVSLLQRSITLLASDTAIAHIGVLLAVHTALVIAALVALLAEPVMSRGRTVALSASLVAALTPAVAGAWFVIPQWRMTKEVFVTAPVADPTPLPATVYTTTLPPPPSQARGRVNVLLLGGDAGPRRWGLRTDAMHVVSIDLDTHDTAIVSIPRNLYGAPLPPGLKERFPRGFPNLANAVYGWGEANPELTRAALGPTDAPGASLTAAMIAELTGLRIDAWVLADMQGFLDLVDAFGGVDIFVPKAVPAAGNVPGGKHPVRNFTTGWHRMDGTDALSYARSRKADSDYQRMVRQRCVLASLAAQTDPVTLAWRWPQIISVLSRSLRTNLTPELLTTLKDLAGTDTSNARTLSLNPPLVPAGRWDPATVRALVAATVTPPNPSPASPSPTVSSPTVSSPAPASTLAPVTPAAQPASISSACRVKP